MGRGTTLRFKRGQALVELTLIFPMLVALSLGAVEIGNLIYTYQVIHHLTAQGANIAARLTPPPTIDTVMSAVVDAACPVLSQGTTGAPNCPASNTSKWLVIYTEIGPDPISPATYGVKEQRVLGSGSPNPAKRICAACGLANYTCPVGAPCPVPNVPNIATIGAGQSLYAFEVFYDYTPITVLGNFVGTSFMDKLYERSIF
jgi:TadE-like protein